MTKLEIIFTIVLGLFLLYVIFLKWRLRIKNRIIDSLCVDVYDLLEYNKKKVDDRNEEFFKKMQEKYGEKK